MNRLTEGGTAAFYLPPRRRRDAFKTEWYAPMMMMIDLIDSVYVTYIS